MRKVTLFGLLLGAVVVACESKTPTGPSTVTVQETTTTTVPATTTTVPGQSTTVPPTTTSVMLTSMTRRYLGSSGNPVLPNDMTLALALVIGGSFETLHEGGPVSRTQATYSVTGFYRTGSGGGGNVRGTLDGTLDSGTFSGMMTADVPGCTASREYSGQLTATSLTWAGGRSDLDCKDNPLSFSNLTMVAAGGALPPTTTIPTTTTPGCNYGLNPGGANIGLSGGSGSVQVITQPGCGWSAQSVVNWVTLQPASGSSGPGSVQYTATAGGPRETTLIIAGLPFVLRQDTSPTTTTTTAACTYALSPTSATVPAAGGAGSVTVISQPGCAWSVQTFAPWITATPSSGTGSGQVSYTAAAAPAARESTIVIAGLPFLLRQDAPIVPADLVPYTTLTGSEPYCRVQGSNFLVGVRNAGAGAAAGSVTRVSFTPNDGTPSSSSLPTVALPAGGIVDVVFAYPSDCSFGGGCSIQIVVDANNDLAEGVTGEGNNAVTARCDYPGTRGRPR